MGQGDSRNRHEGRMMEARARLTRMINGCWTTQVIYTACELGIPDLLAAGPRGVASLASASGTHTGALLRLMRALASLDLCAERGDGVFELTAEGAMLKSEGDDSLHGWVLMTGRRMWASWGQLIESVRTGASARKRVHGEEDFSGLERDKDAAETFNRAMIDLTRPVALALARTIDLAGVRLAVDVGGGAGQLIATVLAHHPGLHGIVFDLPHATEAATRQLSAAGVADRCEVVAGSFFDAAPEADAYLLKSVVHNWDDERAALILRNCRKAMRPGGKILLVERVAPERFSNSSADQDIARSDLNMLVGCDGCERTEARFRSLLAAAGLELKNVQKLASDYSVVTAAL